MQIDYGDGLNFMGNAGVVIIRPWAKKVNLHDLPRLGDGFSGKRKVAVLASGLFLLAAYIIVGEEN